ncbi:MAG TPA: hypothetical protein VF816_08270 [Rhodocyclaceae bacterium]
MEWEFSPQAVVKGEAFYGFGDFRRDLLCEVLMNAGGGSAEESRATFDLLFDLCYWLATERRFEDFAAQHHHSPQVSQFLHDVRAAMAANAEMLGAILQRMIMAEAEGGLPLQDAVARVHRIVAQESLSLPADAPALAAGR